MISAVPAPTLADQLRAEGEEYRKLEALLEEERQALADVQAERVSAIAAEKTTVYSRLQMLARRRDACLAAGGVTTAPGAIRAWAERHPNESGPVLTEWHSLTQLVRKTRRQNTLNGRIANAMAQSFSARLNMLTGNQTGNATTYGRDGSTNVSILRTPGSIAQA